MTRLLAEDGIAWRFEENSEAPASHGFLLTAVTHAGINNLPKDLSQRIAARLDQGGADLLSDWVDPEVRAQAVKTGYGNAFEAIRAHVPWRPALTADSGQRLNPKPTVDGPLVASVVGSDGADPATAGGAEQIHTDRLGRIRIRHDFQNAGESSTWVRVLQRYAEQRQQSGTRLRRPHWLLTFSATTLRMPLHLLRFASAPERELFRVDHCARSGQSAAARGFGQAHRHADKEWRDRRVQSPAVA